LTLVQILPKEILLVVTAKLRAKIVRVKHQCLVGIRGAFGPLANWNQENGQAFQTDFRRDDRGFGQIGAPDCRFRLRNEKHQMGMPVPDPGSDSIGYLGTIVEFSVLGACASDCQATTSKATNTILLALSLKIFNFIDFSGNGDPNTALVQNARQLNDDTKVKRDTNAETFAATAFSPNQKGAARRLLQDFVIF